MTNTILTVALSALDIDPANVRKTDTEPPVSLIASLKAKGQIEPLIVRPNGRPGHFLVTNGGMRLRALRALAEKGDIAADHQVDVIIRDDNEAEAADTSLTTFVRDDLHPVDEYEAFAALALTPKEIAKRYGLKTKRVMQVLALGKLSPVIRQAWRDDKIDTETAQAFTIQPEHAEQDKLFEALSQRGYFNQYMVRQAIIGERGADAAMMKLVGREAYEAAGGKIIQDLFGDTTILSDAALLKRMADEKLAEKIKAFTDLGWGWARVIEPYGDVPRMARYGWGPFKFEQDGVPPEPVATEGVIIDFKHDGGIEALYGAVDPATKRKAEKAKAKDRDGEQAKAEPTVSNALRLRLSEQMTQAAAQAITSVDHKIALAALIAGFTSYESMSPVKVTDRGLASASKSREMAKGNFETKFAAALKLSVEQQVANLAIVASRALDLRVFNAQASEQKQHKPLLNALGDTLVAQLRKGWDAKDYLGSVNKAFLLKAIAEAVSPAEAKKLENKPKADVAKFAIANVPKTGWLPTELRTPSYKLTKAAKKPAPAKKEKPAKTEA